jgi:hypothetical protein
MKYLFFLLPFSAYAQVEPFAGIQAGVNFGTGLHAGAEAGVSVNRRFIAAVDYTAYFGVFNKHAAGVKVGVATIYKDSDGLCPVYVIAGASQGHYRGSDGKPYQTITPTFAVRVQTYNGYWEAGRQNGFWSFTVGYQFRRIYD